MKTRTHRSTARRSDLDDLFDRDDRRVAVDVRFRHALQILGLSELLRTTRDLLVDTAIAHSASDADAEDAVHDVVLQVLEGDVAISKDPRWAVEELKHLVIARCRA
jgi:hypothetical protein